jgi:hypothetical protein
LNFGFNFRGAHVIISLPFLPSSASPSACTAPQLLACLLLGPRSPHLTDTQGELPSSLPHSAPRSHHEHRKLHAASANHSFLMMWGPPSFLLCTSTDAVGLESDSDCSFDLSASQVDQWRAARVGLGLFLQPFKMESSRYLPSNPQLPRV